MLFRSLDTVTKDSAEHIKKLLSGYRSAVCYGVCDSIEDVKNADRVRKNLVVSPSGLRAAREMKDAFGIPYEAGYPIAREYSEEFCGRIHEEKPCRVLVIHQQVFANEIRRLVESVHGVRKVDVATWFMLDDEIARKDDRTLREEDELLELVQSGEYDTVIGDPLFRRALPGWEGRYLSLPHFAVSGSLHESPDEDAYWRKAGERI